MLNDSEFRGRRWVLAIVGCVLFTQQFIVSVPQLWCKTPHELVYSHQLFGSLLLRETDPSIGILKYLAEGHQMCVGVVIVRS
jgi:hypothetical protein